MRTSLLSIILISLFGFSFAHTPTPEPPREGMWIPILLEQLNYSEMQDMGLRLTPEDIYSVNNSSMKDAVIHFGGGCTGEVVSSKGLIFTNHHCGYSMIQSHSSVENDYLTDGFWAMDQSQELPNEGLKVTFIVRIEDVSEQVLDGVSESDSEGEREVKVQENISKIKKEATQGTHYDAKIRPFYYGAEYYMFITETFEDIRLVGAPPSSIGKYGGDTDNWMWPRHTGDFSVFRIYADKDNNPAEYSEDNVPYTPKHFFPINLKPLNKGDFTMVYGFPGRTEEYLTHHAVQHTLDYANPAKIEIRRKRLDLMEDDMKASDAVRIQYASKHARISNYWKKWRGESRGLKKLDAVNKKIQTEQAFFDWMNEDPKRLEKYGKVMEEFENIYSQMGPLSIARDYINEAAFGIEVVAFASRFRGLVSTAKEDNADQEDIQEEVERMKRRAGGFFKNYHQPIDRETAPVMLEMYAKNVAPKYHPSIFKEVDTKYKGDFNRYTENLFETSNLVTEDRVNALLNDFSEKSVKKLEEDPAYVLMESILDLFNSEIRADYYGLQDAIDLLSRTYVQGLREMKPNYKFYPDANSTLRLSYGQVDDYEPRDGVQYLHYTTIEGIMQKYDPNHDDFQLPDRLIELYKQKDYGQYAQNSELRVAFTASNHTTGGNSGSPVLNGDGHLVGINFDRNWEGTMSDIMYDPDRVRNISVDVHYVLFIIDKYAGAKHLIDEMKIMK